MFVICLQILISGISCSDEIVFHGDVSNNFSCFVFIACFSDFIDEVMFVYNGHESQGEVTSQNLWSRYDRHFVGITRHNALG